MMLSKNVNISFIFYIVFTFYSFTVCYITLLSLWAVKVSGLTYVRVYTDMIRMVVFNNSDIF